MEENSNKNIPSLGGMLGMKSQELVQNFIGYEYVADEGKKHIKAFSTTFNENKLFQILLSLDGKDIELVKSSMFPMSVPQFEFSSITDFINWAGKVNSQKNNCFLYKSNTWLCFEFDKNKFTTLTKFLNKEKGTNEMATMKIKNDRISSAKIDSTAEQNNAEQKANEEREKCIKESKEAVEKLNAAISLLKESADLYNPVAELLYGTLLAIKRDDILDHANALKYLYRASNRSDTKRVAIHVYNSLYDYNTAPLFGTNCVNINNNMSPYNQLQYVNPNLNQFVQQSDKIIQPTDNPKIIFN